MADVIEFKKRAEKLNLKIKPLEVLCCTRCKNDEWLITIEWNAHCTKCGKLRTFEDEC